MRIDIYHHNAEDCKGEKHESQNLNWINDYFLKLLERQALFEERVISHFELLAKGIRKVEENQYRIHKELNDSFHVIHTILGETKDLIIINNQKQNTIMKTLDEVLTDVQSESTLIDGLRQQLADALSGVLNPDQQAKVDAIFDAAEANKAKLAAAAATNTPAEGQPGTGTDTGADGAGEEGLPG